MSKGGWGLLDSGVPHYKRLLQRRATLAGSLLWYNENERNIMPVHAVRSAGGKIIGWQFGTTGKIYKTKQEAEEQERAIRASGWSGDGDSNNDRY